MLLNHRRALLFAGILLAATAVLFVLVKLPGTHPLVQRIDDRVYDWMQNARNPVITFVAKVLNVVGGGPVTIPLRIIVALYLLLRRRWRAFSAWVLTWITAEVSLTALKAWYDRPRPPHPLVSTTGASFPSGHAVAVAATGVALVLVLLPEGPRRRKWEVLAVVFAFVMAFSRVYLNAHWLSDVVAGIGLGFAIAVGATALVTEARDVAVRRREPAAQAR